MPPCTNTSGWWCYNEVGDVFLAHFEPLSITWATVTWHSLPEYRWWKWPSLLWPQCSDGCGITHHTIKLKSSQSGFLIVAMSSLYLLNLCHQELFNLKLKGGQLLMKHHQWLVVSNTRLGVSTPVSTPVWPAEWLWKIWGRAYFKHLCW